MSCVYCGVEQVNGEDVYQHVLYPHYLAIARVLLECVVDHGSPAAQSAAHDPRVRKVFDFAAKNTSGSWWYELCVRRVSGLVATGRCSVVTGPPPPPRIYHRSDTVDRPILIVVCISGPCVVRSCSASKSSSYV